jgi:hypothetical protein
MPNRWAPQLQPVLGELGLEVAAPGDQFGGAGACLAVNGMVARAVASATHRERVLPAGHVGLQVGDRRLELGLQAIGHTFMLRRVLGDQRPQLGRALADGAVLRVIADAAAVPHREGVLPRGEELLEFGAERIKVRFHGRRPPVGSTGIPSE